MDRTGKGGGSWVFVAVLVAAAACGGSTVSSTGDGGSGAPDGGSGAGDAHVAVEASGGDDVDASVDAARPDTGTTTLAYDGTTGKACTSSSDCAAPNGPGNAVCSSVVFAPQSYYPTPVCILPTCSPVSDTTLHYCDGPDDPSSPGICVPQSTGGICLPKCTFDKNGGAAVGCTGKDVCAAYTSAPGDGVGYCWGGCTQDGDCPTGQHCQTDQGLCEEGVVPPTKAFGAACTEADTNSGACNCLYGGTSQDGYCSRFCIVGGASTCPAGSVCDGLEYRQDGFSTSNPGMSGFCAIACDASDAGTTCPSTSTCTDIFAAGPDCVP